MMVMVMVIVMVAAAVTASLSLSSYSVAVGGDADIAFKVSEAKGGRQQGERERASSHAFAKRGGGDSKAGSRKACVRWGKKRKMTLPPRLHEG